ncbi:MAG: hypothetical protein P0116_16040 [Candidatus Nitrosocosmicus sp.]|nr:hypothetical protein [Candidatus Nitrosocosmicus sp.]
MQARTNSSTIQSQNSDTASITAPSSTPSLVKTLTGPELQIPQMVTRFLLTVIDYFDKHRQEAFR